MEAIQISVGNPNPPNSTIHLLPCKISHDGPGNVAGYFYPTINSGSSTPTDKRSKGEKIVLKKVNII